MHREQSIATRLLDQCALDDGVLVALCEDDPGHVAEVSRFERRLGLRRIAKNVPLVGPMIRSVYVWIRQGRRFGR